jgi:FkbM family methyltransferase
MYDRASLCDYEAIPVILKKVLSRLTGNQFMQTRLQRTVQILLYLMGIGSGSDVLFSGEHAIFTVLREKVQPPYCVFDVGSNKGQFLQLVIDSFPDEDLMVHCFEPGSAAFRSLLDLSKMLDVKIRPRLNNIALSNEGGSSPLYFDNVGSPLSSLTKRKLGHYGIEFEKSEIVEIQTIDDYCLANGVNRINLLKIDVEGHELNTLQGAKQMLESGSVDVVSFEFGGTNIDTRIFFRDIWLFLDEVRMRVFRITPSGYLHAIDRYREIEEQFSPTNFVAVSKT